LEEKEENLVKKTCRELGITQKELAKYFGVTPKTGLLKGTNYQVILI
jgi:DNA-binding XRE family transcriptional regulator